MSNNFNLHLYLHHKLDSGISHRVYYRVIIYKESYIFCHYPEDLHQMKQDFLFRTNKLRINNINTLKIIGIYSNGLLLEDLGNERLDFFFTNASPDKYLQKCRHVFKEVEKIHEIYFTHKKEIHYQNNITYFFESASNLLKSPWFGNIELEKDSITRLIQRAIEAINTKDTKYTYSMSDFQSRNIMIKNNVPYLIDYQDIRLLPIEVDYGAFIADPYVDYSQKDIENILTLINGEKYNLYKIIGRSLIKLFHALRLYLFQIYGENNNSYLIPLRIGVKRISLLDNLFNIT